MNRHHHRRGSLLIIVAGVAGVLAMLALTFLAVMRADAQESLAVMRLAQARLMLTASCQYVLEASRVGYGQECYGWIDVRDGRLGPKPTVGGDDDSRFPIGHVVRAPMVVLRRPPYAIRPLTAPNAIESDPTRPFFGIPLLAKPDPLPVAATWSDHADGDWTPRPESTNLAWFRVCRVAPAQFVVTCGTGGTQGWKDWAEVDDKAAFGDDPSHFAELLAGEARLWYRIEWSAAVLPDQIYSSNSDRGTRNVKYPHPDLAGAFIDHKTPMDDYRLMPTNASQQLGSGDGQSVTFTRNHGGTIRWIERLPGPPSDGRW